MATLREIADSVGISVATASMAVRDHHSVSLETKQRVWEVQERLGYRMEMRRRIQPVGPVEPEVQPIAFLLIDRQIDDAGGYGRLFQNVTVEAGRRKFSVSLVTASLEDLRQGRIPEILLKGNKKGLIVAGHCDRQAHSHLSKLGLPMVKDGNFSSDDDPWMTCEPDFDSGVRLLVRRVEEFGHTRIGLMLRDTTSEFSQHVQDYFLRELNFRKLTNAGICTEACSPAGIREGFLQLVRDGATAIALGSGSFAAEIYDAAEEHGIRIPADLSVVALGSAGMLMRPGLAYTTAEDRSEAMVTKLAQMMKNPRQIPTRELFPMRFTPGGSLGPAPTLSPAKPQTKPTKK